MDNKERFLCLFLTLFIALCSVKTTFSMEPIKESQQQKQQQQPKTDIINKNPIHQQQQNMNFSNGKFDWEGGSFPYDENEADSKDGTVFYNRTLLVAPIVGSVFIIILVVAGVYALRQYDIPECNRGKDVENICHNCSKLRRQGLHNKLQNYVMRLFDISANKHEAFFIQMDPKSRTAQAHRGARETLV